MSSNLWNYVIPGANASGNGDVSAEERAQIQLVQAAADSCLAKCIISGVVGSGLGVMFGIFTSSMRYDTPISSSPEITSLPIRQQIKLGFRDMYRTAISTGRNFGIVGAIFSGSECCIESFRAKNDIWNGLWAGCFTGGVLARKSGPKAAALGAGGFALFSLAIEYWLRKPEDEKRYAL